MSKTLSELSYEGSTTYAKDSNSQYRRMTAGHLKQVVYIASVGHSGSTLLDMLLGANDGITSLGEIYRLAWYARDNASCTCGEPIAECPFWSQVEEKLQDRLNSRTKLRDFDLTEEGVNQTMFRKLPSLTDIGLVAGHRGVWNGICVTNKKANLYRQAAKNCVVVYELACAVDGGDTVVDSSKYSLPLKARYMELGSKMKIIFLIRDGRGVTKSLVKSQKLTYEQAARKWTRFNWNLRLIVRSIPESQIFQLKYEDLCADASGTLDALTGFLGRAEPLEIRPLLKDRHHDIGGNPMRFRRSETTIKLDDSWRQTITNEEHDLFQKIAGKTNKKYGY